MTVRESYFRVLEHGSLVEDRVYYRMIKKCVQGDQKTVTVVGESL